MTVLEIESPQDSTRATSVLPFERNRTVSGSPDSDRPVGAGVLTCPNIAELPPLQLQKAQRLIDEMSEALITEMVDTFNEAKRQLFQLIRKHGAPITQWHPLVLVLSNADCLRGAKLPQINLDMVRLSAEQGAENKLISLQGASLPGAGFLCADLSQVCLVEADLTGADLRFADLRESDLSRTLLIEADLSNAKLSFAKFDEANLYCAKMNGALVKQASLRNANLRKADLRHVDFYQADLTQARLQQADMREANLFMANLTEAKLRQVDLRKANLGFCCLKQARLQNARLLGVVFASADLTLADLQQCRLSGVVLSRALMNETNLMGAELQGVDLSECLELEAAVLQGAQFDGETLFPKGFKPKKHELVNLQFHGLSRLIRLLPAFLNQKVSATTVVNQ
jgi:uncharacterized protein YjbI with pentapeptide repeats